MSLQGCQIGNEIVAIAFGNALENPHGGAWYHLGWKHHPPAHRVGGPFPSRLALERIGVNEARNRAGLLAENAEQIRPQAVLAALVDGMANRALANECGLALGGIAVRPRRACTKAGERQCCADPANRTTCEPCTLARFPPEHAFSKLCVHHCDCGLLRSSTCLYRFHDHFQVHPRPTALYWPQRCSRGA